MEVRELIDTEELYHVNIETVYQELRSTLKYQKETFKSANEVLTEYELQSQPPHINVKTLLHETQRIAHSINIRTMISIQAIKDGVQIIKRREDKKLTCFLDKKVR